MLLQADSNPTLISERGSCKNMQRLHAKSTLLVRMVVNLHYLRHQTGSLTMRPHLIRKKEVGPLRSPKAMARGTHGAQSNHPDNSLISWIN